MYTMVVFVIIGLVAMTSASVPLQPECIRIFHPVATVCCQKPEMKSSKAAHSMEECAAIKNPKLCDIDICVAKKNGFGTDDGNIVREAAMKFMEKEFEATPNIVAAIKKECIEGDISMIGRPDSCEVTKLGRCVNREFLKNCEEWKNGSYCGAVKNLVKKCLG